MATKRKSSKKSAGALSRTRKSGRVGPTWTESARWAGAVHPSGKVMKKAEALSAKITVPGHIDKRMISKWFGMVKPGMRKNSAKYKAAVAMLKLNAKKLKEKRQKRGSPWLATRRSQRAKGKKVRGAKGRFTGQTTKGKWLPGRGPTTTLKLRKGFSPTKAQIKRLIEGGFGGPTGAQGGKVKLNRGTKKRRRRAKTGSRRRVTTKKNPKRRRKAVAKNPKRRRKAVAKKNPSRKRKAVAKKNPSRKRKSTKRRKSVKRNPGFKLARRKSGSKRVRRNPGAVDTLKSALMKPIEGSLWVTTAHILAGSGMTYAASNFLRQQRFVPFALKAGRGEVVLDLVSTGLVYGAARLGERYLPNGKLTKNLANNVLVGGAVYTAVKALFLFMPGLARKIGIVPAGNGAAAPVAGYPSYPGQYPGMGSVESPDALVRGESLARQVNEFHGMGQPIPIEDLRGYPGQYGGGMNDWLTLSGSGGMGGMNDWVELSSDNALVQAGFDPGSEAF